MNKYYAVAKGRKIGIFNSWDEVKILVNGFPDAKYKSFQTFLEADKYIKDFQNLQNTILTGWQSKSESTSNTDKKEESTFYMTDIPTISVDKVKLHADDHRIATYTDGSCVDKIGGLGYVVLYKDTTIPFSGKVPIYPCTNQIAELYAIYATIYFLITSYKDDSIKNGIVIYTDSKYSIGCLTQWCYNWIRNGWINSKGESVANKELIQAILHISTGLRIDYIHVKGHNGNYYNEWADRLANSGRVQ